MNKVIKEGEVGVCPYCNKEGCMLYEEFKLVEEQGHYPFKCTNCGGEGEELYCLEFVHFMISK